MVKIERSPTPPASLAVEREKTSGGKYDSLDVITQLNHDFNSKCYLCELDQLTDIEVEHLRPHHGRSLKDRVFDWNNLFYSCRHCNSMKNNRAYDDKILDCCNVDPEMFLDHVYKDSHVKINPHSEDEVITKTAQLLTECFEKRNTGVRYFQCQARINRLAETMNILYKTLEKLKQNPSSKRYLQTLHGLISKKHRFAGFTRYYVKTHLKEYPQLSEKIHFD